MPTPDERAAEIVGDKRHLWEPWVASAGLRVVVDDALAGLITEAVRAAEESAAAAERERCARIAEAVGPPDDPPPDPDFWGAGKEALVRAAAKLQGAAIAEVIRRGDAP